MKKLLLASLLGLAVVAPQAQATFIGTLQETSPTPASYTLSVDFQVLSDNGNAVTGNATGLLESVDVAGVTSGCEAADFTSFTIGHIALIKRGTCTTTQKIINAEAAGASGVLLFNNVAGIFSIAAASATTIPTLTLTGVLGDSLVAEVLAGPVTMQMTVDPTPPAAPEAEIPALLAAGGLVALLRKRRLAV